ncbi:MAG: putative photosynthetic complex assembly protein PuhE [Notoacmeibacter sp.]
MTLIWGTFGLAVLAWWGSTGLIVLAVRSSEKHHSVIMIGAAFMAALGLAALIISADLATTAGAFTAFFGALLIWAFFEVAFLLGWITGPRKTALPPETKGWQRFRFAVETVIYHELALITTLAFLGFFMSGSANHVGVMIFALLWVMRLFSKFILFLGARHSLSEITPLRLAYLQSYFRTDRTTVLFPIVLLLGVAALVFIARAVLASDLAFFIVAHVLAATFMLLALIELVFLNLPVRDSALWAWAMPNTKRLNAGTSLNDQKNRPAQPVRVGGIS